MAYATADQFKRYFDQFAGTSTHDTLIGEVLDRATAIIDTEIGYSFTGGVNPVTTSPQVIYGSGTPLLTLPHRGRTVTAVTAPTGYTVPTYAEITIPLQGSYLHTKDTSGVLYAPWRRRGLGDMTWYTLVWDENTPYTVTATFGWGTAPADVVEACLELAVMIFRFKESGGVGEIGGAETVQTVRAGFSPKTERTLKLCRERNNVDVGVY